MNAPAQLDLLDGTSSLTAAPDAVGDEIPPAVEPDIGPDILFDYHQAGSGLWIVRATHEASGRTSRTTAGAVPVDPLMLEKLAKGARRAV